jgi:LPS export ABC transporter protein LptC
VHRVLLKMTPQTLRVARGALLGTMFALIATILVYIAAGPARRAPQASVPLLSQQADAGLQEFSFAQSKGGLVDWKIQARQAQLFEADAKAVLNDVHVTLMGTDGITMTVAGDEGTINTTSKDFVISKRSGSLALILNGGFTIYTPQIRWDDQALRIWTDESVRITGHRLEVTGQGMDAFPATREMRVRNNVRVGIH